MILLAVPLKVFCLFFCPLGVCRLEELSSNESWDDSAAEAVGSDEEDCDHQLALVHHGRLVTTTVALVLFCAFCTAL